MSVCLPRERKMTCLLDTHPNSICIWRGEEGESLGLVKCLSTELAVLCCLQNPPFRGSHPAADLSQADPCCVGSGGLPPLCFWSCSKTGRQCRLYLPIAADIAQRADRTASLPVLAQRWLGFRCRLPEGGLQPS